VLLYFNNNKEMNKFLFDELFTRKDEIEKDFGDKLEWIRLDDKIASVISFGKSISDRANREEWDAFIDQLETHFLRLKTALEQPLQDAKAAWDKQQAEK
jgi:hypothetical protein